MSVKFYLSVWAIFAIAVFLTFVTGNLSMLTTVWFGFFFLGMIFMGMMNVLPIQVSHRAESKPVEPEPQPLPVMQETPAKAFHVFKSA